MMRALSASRIKTPTYAKPVHIGAGLPYLRTRELKVHLQHPLSQSPSAVVGHACYVFDVP